MFESFYAFTRGYSHIIKNIPCQDAGRKYSFQNMHIICCADGHSDENCFRSHLGSKFAVDVSIEKLKEFAQNIKYEDIVNVSKREKIIKKLITSIVSEWLIKTEEDFENHPLTIDEKSKDIASLEAYLNNEHIPQMYGTTLISCLVTENYMLLLQQGDGHCFVYDENGDYYEPIPWDEHCVANITTSLCDEDTIEQMRFSFIDLTQKKIIACIIATDGLEDSYQANMSLTNKFIRERIFFELEKHRSIMELEKNLNDFLPKVSWNGNAGSTDDITICGLVDRCALSKCHRKFVKDNDFVDMRQKLNKINEKINSMTRKHQILENRKENKKNEVEQFSSYIKNVNSVSKKLKMDLEELSIPKDLIKLDSSEGLRNLIKDVENEITKSVESLIAKLNDSFKKVFLENENISHEFKDYHYQYEELKKEQSKLTKLLHKESDRID